MKKFAVFSTMLISVLVPQVRAQDECSNGSMRGQYSFVASGTFGGAPFAAAVDGLPSAAGQMPEMPFKSCSSS
jgi:hypothetical protein